MSNTRIDSAQGSVQVAQTKQHEGPRPEATPFRAVLAGGANALLTGAEVATGVLGGPVLAAAVREAKADVVGGIAGNGGGASGGAAGAAAAALANPGSEMEQMRAMQRESHTMNLQMLNLQESVAQENRQFTTVSNVAKAQHDTTKAVLQNVHS